MSYEYEYSKEKFWEDFEQYCKSFTYEMIDKKFLGIVTHPLFSNNVFLDDNNEFVTINDKNLNDMVDLRLKQIYKTIDNGLKKENNFESQLKGLIYCINKPFRIEVFIMVQHILDEQAYNDILSYVWVSTEFPNQTPRSILKNLFKKVNKELYMDIEDYTVYKNLPNKVTIYRGLQGNKSKLRAMSWTLSYEKAKWFANRFDYKGKVYKTTIDKDAIYVYENSRGEEEIIVNPYRLNKKIEEVEK